MKVYVLCLEHRNSGHNVIGVFSSLVFAIEVATETFDEMKWDSDELEIDEEPDGCVWLATFGESNHIEIAEVEVDKEEE
jgi:hypothetical protein